jgi:hypothetical protein
MDFPQTHLHPTIAGSLFRRDIYPPMMAADLGD